MPEVTRIRCPICGMMPTEKRFMEDHELRVFRQELGGSLPKEKPAPEPGPRGPGRPRKQHRQGLMKYTDITSEVDIAKLKETINAKNEALQKGEPAVPKPKVPKAAKPPTQEPAPEQS